MRCWLLAVALLVACKGKDSSTDKPKPEPKPEKTTSFVVDPTACGNALDKAANRPLEARAQLLLEGCLVCGREWTPLLQWSTEPANGGPRREQIETVMVDCQAFCTGDSKLKFMAAVDKARGQSVNTPWRQLENACTVHVNGAPDDRFMSAPFFALDRIARAVATSSIASKLEALELPLPALTVSGAGVVLPAVEDVTPEVGAVHVTVLGAQLHVGRLPRGKLTAKGVAVDLGPHGYPGEAVALDQLGAKLAALVGEDKTQTVTLLAPHAMKASELVPIIAAASKIAPVRLAATSRNGRWGAVEGWQLPGAIPLALGAGRDIEVTDEMTVQNLARELAVRAARNELRVGVTKK